MTTLPTVSTLVALAIRDTRFLEEAVDATTSETARAAIIATNQAAEWWEDENSAPVGATVTDAIRAQVAAELVDYAKLIADDAGDTMADAIEAGDRDFGGGWVPFETYRSAS